MFVYLMAYKCIESYDFYKADETGVTVLTSEDLMNIIYLCNNVLISLTIIYIALISLHESNETNFIYERIKSVICGCGKCCKRKRNKK